MPDRILRTRDDAHMQDIRAIDPNEDPVCGMQVDIETAREHGLVHAQDGREYVFCGKGCLLEFRDDPKRFLDASYSPSM